VPTNNFKTYAGYSLIILSCAQPIGIANAMSACAQSVERFKSDVAAHVGQIEAGLALGVESRVTVAPCVQCAVYASLLPRLDMLKSLGLVWRPLAKSMSSPL
jgi:putative ABC transport system permease protein